MEFPKPTTLGEALFAKRTHPNAAPSTGGTEVMVALNLDRRRPSARLGLSRVPEPARCGPDRPHPRLGSA
ncbi:hypothetical protein EFW17_20865 [Halostreptopolyspora alba]|uniref:Uncharacterized protein n=1 Tax=Halostreptopolyspora alba TaxID=2487137 RepID=A0A3N0E2B5_9ACTN|nr:hypothetical protein EFW17_20865 [Nocardiopsaceae bacterium YIM 96095]